VAGASGIFVFPAHQNSERPWPMYRPAEAVPTTLPGSVPAARVVVAFGIPDFDPVSSGWLSGLRSDVVLVWDRQGWLSRARDSAAARALAPAMKIYVANEQEALEEARASTIREVLLQPPPGFRVSLIKRGIRGVTVVERTKQGILCNVGEAFPVETESTIGSGDVFLGAFAARLSIGDSCVDAATWGCAASAIALKVGTNLLDDKALSSAQLLISNRENSLKM
ncbi:MAG: PfkB family carbohydrate kinase, partial [Candidatus Marsarchaeota archaeon]|nr:PfkB family carbohydrate kinase [Candidatus Marsarchaeota archaeon]